MPKETRRVTKFAVVILGCVAFFTATGLDSQLQVLAKSDPLRGLANKWHLTGFVFGGDDPYHSFECGEVTVASPADRTVSLSVTCDNTDYYFLLKHGSETQAYLITVKSKIGISIDDFPVTHVDGRGWHGERDQLVDGETLSITAMVKRIEGRNWYGWSIKVLPTAAIKLSPGEIKKPYFQADLTRRK